MFSSNEAEEQGLFSMSVKKAAFDDGGGARPSGKRQRIVDAHFQAAARSWRDIYNREDLDGQIHRDRLSATLALVGKINLPPRSRVLEAGCGAGGTAAALAGLGYLVTAVDTVGKMLSLARHTASKAGVNGRVELMQRDVHETHFADEQFDLAVAIGVIPWSERPETAIRELARVVKRNGYVILSADNLWCLHHILDPRCFPSLRPMRRKLSDVLERLAVRPASPLRFRYHSIRQFDALLSRAGLEKLEGLTVGFGPFSFFNRTLLSDSAGLKVHERLQALAYGGFPLIRSAGVEYVVLSRRRNGLPREGGMNDEQS